VVVRSRLRGPISVEISTVADLLWGMFSEQVRRGVFLRPFLTPLKKNFCLISYGWTRYHLNHPIPDEGKPDIFLR